MSSLDVQTKTHFFRFVTLGILAVVAAVGVARGGASPGVKCAVAKRKAAVKKIAAKVKCYNKADAAGVFVDTTCLSAADTKFGDAITKAEAKGGCVGADEATLEGACDDCVGNIINLTPVSTTTTTTNPFTCGTSAYPQCGGTCPNGTVCRAFLVLSSECGSTSCQTQCECVPPATACNGQPCTELCMRNSMTQCQGGGTTDFETCCSGGDGPCLAGTSTQCCCAGSCVQPTGQIGSCSQDITCNASHDGSICQ